MDQFHHSFNQAQNQQFSQLQQQQLQQQEQLFLAHNSNVLLNGQQSYQPTTNPSDFAAYSGIQPQLMLQQQQQRLTGQPQQQQQQQQQFFPPASSSSAPVQASTTSTPIQFAPSPSDARQLSQYRATTQSQQPTTLIPPRPQMASPATSQPQQRMQPVSAGGPGSPLPRELIKQEQERVTLLLEINQVILQELINLQKQGKGGNVQAPRNTDGTSKDGSKIASTEYVEYMRCMQANLAYLAADADRHHKQPKILPGPGVMSPPTSEHAELVALYAKLQQLFPGWKGTPPKTNPSSSQSPVATSSANPNSQGGDADKTTTDQTNADT